jgi:hypothetical protein
VTILKFPVPQNLPTLEKVTVNISPSSKLWLEVLTDVGVVPTHKPMVCNPEAYPSLVVVIVTVALGLPVKVTNPDPLMMKEPDEAVPPQV